MHTVTLTSDLGTTDFYVSAVKGAILSAAPRCRSLTLLITFQVMTSFRVHLC